jgi:hypothetical protein
MFLKIKEILKGRHFEVTSGIIQEQLRRPFHKTSSKIVWTRRWHRCIASQGEYFEGDHGGIQQ